MIPILYEKGEKSFTSEGVARLTDAVSCEVEEVLNGVYELELQYPVTGADYDKITEGRIIAALHDDTGKTQPFDIYGHTVPDMDGIVTFYAHHVSYRLSNVILKPFSASSCGEAVGKISQNSINTNEFTFWTDKTVDAPFSLSKPMSVKAVLGGTAGSLLDVYGKAEYEFDRFEVKMHLNRGRDNGAEIRYGKNMTRLRREYSELSTYNAIAPYWHDMDGKGLVTPEGYIVTCDEAIKRTAPDGTEYEEPLKPVAVDMSSEFDEKPTAQALKDRALELFRQRQSWVPDDTFEVDFVALWQTEEYKNIAPIERIRLGDTVHVVYPENGIKAKVKAVRTLYDCLLERYREIELGVVRSSFADVLRANTERAMAGTYATIGSINAQLSGYASIEDVNETAQRITGNKGGYKVDLFDADGKPYGTAYMDTPDINTAQKILMLNKEGIAGTAGGINGNFGVAITTDGKINADSINYGTMQGVTVIAENGEIGGWTISNDSLYSTYEVDGETNRVSLHPITQTDRWIIASTYMDEGVQKARLYLAADGSAYIPTIVSHLHAKEGLRVGSSDATKEAWIYGTLAVRGIFSAGANGTPCQFVVYGTEWHHGTVSFDGNVNVGSDDSNKNLTVKGTVAAKTVNVDGAITAGGAATAKSLTVEGTIKGKSLDLASDGALMVDGKGLADLTWFSVTGRDGNIYQTIGHRG